MLKRTFSIQSDPIPLVAASQTSKVNVCGKFKKMTLKQNANLSKFSFNTNDYS